MGVRESQHLIVPLKRGNQPEGPRRGKEVPSHEPLKGNMPGTLRPEPCPRNDDGSRGSRIHEMRNRVRVMCTPGSVGDLGGQPPRSTRPLAPRLPAKEGAASLTLRTLGAISRSHRRPIPSNPPHRCHHRHSHPAAPPIPRRNASSKRLFASASRCEKPYLFYPHFAIPSALRAAGASRSPAPKEREWPRSRS